MSDEKKPPFAPRKDITDEHVRLLRVIAPLAVLAVGIGLWSLIVRVNNIQPYVLPGPEAVFKTLIDDWGVLSSSLLVTLWTTLEGFIAAAVGGIVLALLFNQSKWLEVSLFPYAVILQVTPVIAIAPRLSVNRISSSPPTAPIAE